MKPALEQVDTVDHLRNNRYIYAHLTLCSGCYWGTEAYFKKKFKETLSGGEVGYMGGNDQNPTYEDVCTGRTGHVEVYHFHFNGGEEEFENIVRHFFTFHDPTTLNRQGHDQGTQYGSVIFTYDSIQHEIATKVISEVQALIDNGKLTTFEGSKVTTELRESKVFYAARPDHQAYLDKNPSGYCNHKIRFQWSYINN